MSDTTMIVTDHNGMRIYELTRTITDATEAATERASWAASRLTAPQFLAVGIAEYGREALLEAFVPPVVEDEERWRLPVGEEGYPAKDWYCANFHAIGHHIGLDINIDGYGYGDAERTLGLHVFAVADGIIEYVNEGAWDNGTDGVIVARHFWKRRTYYVRYGHIVPGLAFVGMPVKKGDILGEFADWRTGDHLHLDICEQNQKARYDINGVRGLYFLDPQPILIEACGAEEFWAMCNRGY